MKEPAKFRVGITHDFLGADGKLAFGDIGLDSLQAQPRLEVEFLRDHGHELPTEVARDFDALLVLAPRLTANTLAGGARLTIVARFGVGYDNVDVEACTNRDVLL